MTHEDMIAIARGNIERHLADVASEYSEGPNESQLYDEVYVLALDALVDAGVGEHEAGEIACELATEYTS